MSLRATGQPRTRFLPFYLWYGGPCVVVWTVYLLGLWPAVMTDDSIDQWGQLTTLRLTGYHPPFHTLMEWAITRVVPSPAAIAVAQILGLSLAFAAVLYACARRGVPRSGIWATVLVFALAPANGYFAVTLWKDIPYAIAMLCLLAVLMRLVEEPGAALRRWRFRIAILAIVVCLGLLRHNGLPDGIAFLAVLALFTRGGARKTSVGLALAATVIVLSVTQGGYRLLHVRPMPAILRAQVPINHVGAIVASGVPLSDRDAALLASILPLNRWRDDYRCETVGWITHGFGTKDGPNLAAYDAHQAEFFALWLRLVWKAPLPVLRHEVCATAVIWNPLATYYGVTSVTSPNSLGLRMQPVSNAIHNAVYRVWEMTFGTGFRSLVRFFVWGPSFHLGIVIVCFAWVARRRRAILPALPLAPALVHTAVLLPLIPTFEFRLQYPVFVYGLVAPIVALAIVRREVGEAVTTAAASST